MKRSTCLLILSLLFSLSINAQRYEIGAFLGGNNIIGDIDNEYYNFPNNISAGMLFKWNVNERLALRSNLGLSFASASIDKSWIRYNNNEPGGIHSFYGDGYGVNNYFEKGIANVEVLAEWSLLDFVTFHKNVHSPYMTIGVGALAFQYSGKTAILDNGNKIPVNEIKDGDIINEYSDYNGIDYSITIPFGVGYKYLINYKWAAGVDLMFRYTFTDNLDDSGVKNVGNINSNDWFPTVGFTITYVFGRPPCYFCSAKD
ncbi:MAG: hypothetical protein KAG96_02300 [Ichthyobacteriaceae bacterium]|nr:hypothetical protein [Ichthyobacteriaceae bacterium]